MGSVVLADRAWGVAGVWTGDHRSDMPYSFKGFLGERNFCIRDEKGEKLAWANTLWTYVDLKTTSDQSSEEEQEAYVLHEKLDMDYAPRKIALPEKWKRKRAF